MAEKQVRCWEIGEQGEVYAAHTEEEVKTYLASLIGEEDAAESIAELFREMSPGAMDAEISMEGDGPGITTLRRVAEECELPTQIASYYW